MIQGNLSSHWLSSTELGRKDNIVNVTNTSIDTYESWLPFYAIKRSTVLIMISTYVPLEACSRLQFVLNTKVGKEREKIEENVVT